MDSDGLNRSLDRVRENLHDFVASGSTEAAERRRSALASLMKRAFVPVVVITVVGSIAFSKLGKQMGFEREAPHELLGTLEAQYADSEEEDGGPTKADEVGDEPIPEKPVAKEPSKVEAKKEAEAPSEFGKEEEEKGDAVEQPSEEVVVDEEPSPPSRVIEEPVTPPAEDPGELPSQASPSNSGRVIFPAKFGVGSAEPAISDPALGGALTLVAQCPGAVVVEGHSDSIGSPQRNEIVARERAEAVARLLIERGADGSRFEVVSLGATRPIAEDVAEEGRSKNRRVELWCR